MNVRYNTICDVCYEIYLIIDYIIYTQEVCLLNVKFSKMSKQTFIKPVRKVLVPAINMIYNTMCFTVNDFTYTQDVCLLKVSSNQKCQAYL